MPLKSVVAQFGNTEIKVENTWFGGARLLVDQKEVAVNKDYFALRKSKPLMTARVPIEGVERLIEIFVSALFTVKIKICVDGAQVGGDRF